MYRRAYHKGKGRALSGRSPNTMYLRTMRGRFVFPLVLMLLSQVLAAQLPMPELSAGTLIRIDSFASSYVDARPVDIWLPPGYETTQQYPVLYMQDGQMLFDARTTWNKQEWGMDEVIPALIDSGQIQAFILVAVWNNAPVRYLEYTSMKPFVYFSDSDMAILRDEPATGRLFTGDNLKGDLYLRFLVSELKPYIDSHYPTLSGREDTFIMGSSFGGLISMFAICEYPEVFGGAACLSTHWTGLYRQENNPFPFAMLAYFKDHLPDPSTHKLYFDHGTTTLDSLYAPYQQSADQIMREGGYTSANSLSLVFEGAPHTEEAWHDRVHIPLTFLFGKGDDH